MAISVPIPTFRHSEDGVRRISNSTSLLQSERIEFLSEQREFRNSGEGSKQTLKQVQGDTTKSPLPLDNVILRAKPEETQTRDTSYTGDINECLTSSHSTLPPLRYASRNRKSRLRYFLVPSGEGNNLKILSLFFTRNQ